MQLSIAYWFLCIYTKKKKKKDSRSTAQLLDLFEITHTATGLKLNPITVVKDVSGLNLISSYPNWCEVGITSLNNLTLEYPPKKTTKKHTHNNNHKSTNHEGAKEGPILARRHTLSRTQICSSCFTRITRANLMNRLWSKLLVMPRW